MIFQSALKATNKKVFFLLERLELSYFVDETQALKMLSYLPLLLRFVISKAEELRLETPHLSPKIHVFCFVELTTNAKTYRFARFQKFRSVILKLLSSDQQHCPLGTCYKSKLSAPYSMPNKIETLGVGPAICFNRPSW